MVDNPHPLTRYRKANNLTITALAHELGVSKAAVSRWEGGRLPHKKLWPVIREKTKVKPQELVRFAAASGEGGDG